MVVGSNAENHSSSPGSSVAQTRCPMASNSEAVSSGSLSAFRVLCGIRFTQPVKPRLLVDIFTGGFSIIVRSRKWVGGVMNS